MISALIQGALFADPVERETAKGGRYATASIRVSAGAEQLFIGLSTFEAPAVEKLLGLKKGDQVAATGTLEPNVWTTRDGTERKGWRLTATAILTVYEAGRRRKAAQAEAESAG